MFTLMFTFASTLAPLSVPAPADPTTATPRLVTQALGRPSGANHGDSGGFVWQAGRMCRSPRSAAGLPISRHRIRAMQLQTSPPDNEIPVVLPVAAVLGRTATSPSR